MAEMKFRKITGHSILDEIQSVRIEKVKRMLQETDRNLSVMANLCGLKNQNSLCKLFRKETGMTMTDWRRSHIG